MLRAYEERGKHSDGQSESNSLSVGWKPLEVYHSVSFQISGCTLPASTPISA